MEDNMTKNPEFSNNCLAYFRLWIKTLHQNCKGKTRCICHKGAYNLTVIRFDCIKRGMPDLHPGLESEIWSRAFEIHNKSCNNNTESRSSINPTWSDPKDGNVHKICDCFERAYIEYTENNDIIIVMNDYILEERVV